MSTTDDALLAANPTYRFNVLRQQAGFGDAESMLKLGFIYLQGIFRPRDYAQARAWFEAAAKRDMPGARLALGTMYMHGWGVRKDLLQARVLYQLEAKANPFASSISIARLLRSANDLDGARLWYQAALAAGTAGNSHHADGKIEAERFLNPPPPPPTKVSVNVGTPKIDITTPAPQVIVGQPKRTVTEFERDPKTLEIVRSIAERED